ncbi:MAG: translocation/assembly module TamB [Elusimicrobiota bacterium]|nr:translocation/assembly module TamB [Elusimicrobiota bacterium]
MKKKFNKQIIYIFIVSLIISLNCSLIIAGFLGKFLSQAINAETEVSFLAFSLLDPKVIIKSVKVKGGAEAKNIIINLAPSRIFSKTVSPIQYLQFLKISEVEISNSFNNFTNSPNHKISPRLIQSILLPSYVFNVKIERFFLFNEQERRLLFSDLNANFDSQKTNASADLRFADPIDIKFDLELIATADNNIAATITLFSNKTLEFYCALNSVVDLSNFNIETILTIEKLKYENFLLENISGKIMKTQNDFNIAIDQPSIKLNINSPDFNMFAINAFFDIAQINNEASGLINLDAKIDFDGAIDAKISAKNLVLYSLQFADFTSYISNVGGGYKISHKYARDSELLININKNLDEVDFKIDIKRHPIGFGWLNLRTGQADIDLLNVQVKDLPLKPLAKEFQSGIIFASGVIGVDNGRIDFRIDNFTANQNVMTQLLGFAERKAGDLNLNFYSTDGLIEFNSTFVKSKDLDKQQSAVGKLQNLDFKFTNSDTEKYLRALGVRLDLSGFATGRISYAAGESFIVDLMISNGSFANNAFSSFTLKGQADKNTISLQKISLIDPAGKTLLSAAGDIIFLEELGNSHLEIELDDFKLGATPISAKISFNAKAGNQINVGLTNIDYLNIGKVKFINIAAPASISKAEINISSIKSKEGLAGWIKYDISQKTLRGDISFSNFDISEIFEGLNAKINASAYISGSLTDINIDGDIVSSNARFNGVIIDASADYRYAEKELIVYDGNIVIDKKGRIDFEGLYSQRKGINFTVKNLPWTSVSKFFNFENTAFAGLLNGTGVVRNRNGSAQISLNGRSVNMKVDNININEFNVRMQAYKKVVSVSEAFLQISDAQIKNVEGYFNIDEGRYNLNGQLINIHVSLLDIFGKFELDGSINTLNAQKAFSGHLLLNDFWINRARLDNYRIRFDLVSNILLASHRDAKNNIDLSLEYDLENSEINRFRFIGSGGSIFEANAAFKKNDFRLNVSGRNIDMQGASEFLGLDLDFEGSMDLLFQTRGSLRNPTMSFILNSQKGSVMQVPYDYARIEFEAVDNMASIKVAQVHKDNEFDLSVLGQFPIWLDKSVEESLQKRSINITYSLMDSRLRILSYLTDNFIRAKSMMLSVRGNIFGSIKNIEHSGQLIINGGTIYMQDYLTTLKDVKIDISWDRDSVNIKNFTARSGGGLITVTGGAFGGFNDSMNLDLHLFTGPKGIPFRLSKMPISKLLVKDVSQGTPIFDIKISGNISQPEISGKIILEKTHFNYTTEGYKNSDGSLLENSIYNIDIVSGKNTVYENSFANIAINGKINISGQGADIKVNGEVEAQYGQISYLGIGFNIASAKCEIINNSMYITGEADVTTYNSKTESEEVMRVSVDRSSLDDLKLRFASRDDPTLGERDVYARILGVSSDGSDDLNKNANTNADYLLQQRSVRLLNSTFAVPFTQSILRKTGLIDNFRVSYVPDSNYAKKQSAAANAPTVDGGAAAAAADSEGSSGNLQNLLYGTKYSFRKNITNQISLGYSITIDQKANTADAQQNTEESDELELKQEVEMRYRLANNLFVTGTYELGGDAGDYHPDRRIMLQQQFRFGGGRKRLVIPSPQTPSPSQ